jgi:hypothetical protein
MARSCLTSWFGQVLFCSDVPTIEYCSSVWSPHTKDAINKIEMVQRKAARYVINRYRNTSSVTFMPGDLEWDIPNTGGLWEETVFVVICGC